MGKSTYMYLVLSYELVSKYGVHFSMMAKYKT